LTGNEGITIASNSTAIFYTAGSFDIAGKGMVNNGGRPINCQVYGLTTCTSVKYSGNAIYNGTIYAPSADLQIKGGGSAGEVCGAFVAKSLTMTGGTVFHYDEYLGKQGPGSSFNINSWKSYRWTGSYWAAD
jgi:choice-of-anchor A domain-containing protein